MTSFARIRYNKKPIYATTVEGVPKDVKEVESALRAKIPCDKKFNAYFTYENPHTGNIETVKIAVGVNPLAPDGANKITGDITKTVNGVTTVMLQALLPQNYIWYRNKIVGSHYFDTAQGIFVVYLTKAL